MIRELLLEDIPEKKCEILQTSLWPSHLIAARRRGTTSPSGPALSSTFRQTPIALLDELGHESVNLAQPAPLVANLSQSYAGLPPGHSPLTM